MIRAIIAALACLFIAGCATDQPPKIETQIVKVPIYQKAAPPAELLACPVLGTLPKFLDVPGKPDWAGLDAEGQKRLRDLTLAQKGCIDAWSAWAK